MKYWYIVYVCKKKEVMDVFPMSGGNHFSIPEALKHIAKLQKCRENEIVIRTFFEIPEEAAIEYDEYLKSRKV